MTIVTKHIVTLAAAALACLPTMAESKQTVTINGVVSELSIKKITFDGDQLTMTFTDGTTQTEDVTALNVAISYYTSTAISATDAVESEPKAQRVYNINGQLVGNTTDGLPKGVYVAGGKKFVVK